MTIPEGVEADRGRDEDVGDAVGTLELLPVEPIGRDDQIIHRELASRSRKLGVVDLPVPHDEQAQSGEIRTQGRQHAKELNDAFLLLVQSTTDREHLAAVESEPSSKLIQLFLRRKLGLFANGIVNGAVDANAVRGDRAPELIRDDREAIHVARENLADRAVPSRAESKALARNALRRACRVVTKLAAVRFATMKAGQLLIAEGHHVVRGKHDPGTRVARIR